MKLRQYVPVLITLGKNYLPIDHILCKSNLKCRIAQNFDNDAKYFKNISASRVCELLQGGYYSQSNCMRARTLIRKQDTIPVCIMNTLDDSRTIYPDTLGSYMLLMRLLIWCQREINTYMLTEMLKDANAQTTLAMNITIGS